MCVRACARAGWGMGATLDEGEDAVEAPQVHPHAALLPPTHPRRHAGRQARRWPSAVWVRQGRAEAEATEGRGRGGGAMAGAGKTPRWGGRGLAGGSGVGG